MAGVFYLLIFVAAPFAEFFVRDRLVVHGDAAATATNILAHEPLYRLGFAAELITLACDTAVALIFYDLFKPVSRSLSFSAAVFRLIFVAIMSVNTLNYFAPLVLLGGAPSWPHSRQINYKHWHSCVTGCTVRATTSAWCFSDSIAS
jgi:hypothetical protein